MVLILIIKREPCNNETQRTIQISKILMTIRITTVMITEIMLTMVSGNSRNDIHKKSMKTPTRRSMRIKDLVRKTFQTFTGRIVKIRTVIIRIIRTMAAISKRFKTSDVRNR